MVKKKNKIQQKENKKTIAIFLLFIVIFSLLSYHFLLSPKENSFFNNSNNRKNDDLNLVKEKKYVYFFIFFIIILCIIIAVIYCCRKNNKNNPFSSFEEVTKDNIFPYFFKVDFYDFKFFEGLDVFDYKEKKSSIGPIFRLFEDKFEYDRIRFKFSKKEVKIQKNPPYFGEKKTIFYSPYEMIDAICGIASLDYKTIQKYKDYDVRSDFLSYLFSRFFLYFFEYLSFSNYEILFKDERSKKEQYVRCYNSETIKNIKFSFKYGILSETLKKAKEKDPEKYEHISIIDK